MKPLPAPAARTVARLPYLHCRGTFSAATDNVGAPATSHTAIARRFIRTLPSAQSFSGYGLPNGADAPEHPPAVAGWSRVCLFGASLRSAPAYYTPAYYVP